MCELVVQQFFQKKHMEAYKFCTAHAVKEIYTIANMKQCILQRLQQFSQAWSQILFHYNKIKFIFAEIEPGIILPK